MTTTLPMPPHDSTCSIDKACAHPSYPADISGIEMETIREPSMAIPVGIVLVCVIVVALMLLCVQYGRALESCHSDGTHRIPITGCSHG